MVVAQAIRWVAGLTEIKTKPASWGLAELANKLSRVGALGCAGYVVGVGGCLDLLKIRLSQPAGAWAELGNLEEPQMLQGINVFPRERKTISVLGMKQVV